MILCTTHANSDIRLQLNDLYKEWTGQNMDMTCIELNSQWITAMDTETNKIVGAAQLILFDDPVWRRRFGLVENVYVLKEYRCRGVAKDLMNWVEAQARGMRCQFIKLTSSNDKVAGHALYRSREYVEGKSFKKYVYGDKL